VSRNGFTAKVQSVVCVVIAVRLERALENIAIVSQDNGAGVRAPVFLLPASVVCAAGEQPNKER